MTMLTDWIDEAAEKHAEKEIEGAAKCCESCAHKCKNVFTYERYGKDAFKAGARAAIEKLSAMGEDSFDKGAFDKWTTGITDNDWGRVGYNGMLEHAARSQHAQLSALIAARGVEFDVAKFLYAAGYDNDKPLNDSEEWCVRGARSQFLQTQALIAARDARIKELEEYKWKYEQQHKTGEMK